MRRIAPTALLLTLAAAAPAAAQEALPLDAKLTDCHRGPEPADRYAVFVGRMPALAGTERMWMRFELRERLPGGHWHKVGVPKWDRWEKSRPGKPGFIYSKRVGELLAPARYRAVVRFRWYDAQGRLQRRARRSSARCRQPDPRPDLEVGAVSATRADGGRYRYAIGVLNTGRGDAGVFGLVLTVGGEDQPVQRIAGLDGRGSTTVQVTAPACAPGSELRIALDPAAAVDESDEADNAVSRPCPAV